MTVIFPGGEFLEFIFKTVIKNKFLAGNIPVIKRSLLHFKTNYCEIICQGCFHRARTEVNNECCMCCEYAPSNKYAACVGLDIRPNSLRSLILRYTVSLEKGVV